MGARSKPIEDTGCLSSSPSCSTVDAENAMSIEKVGIIGSGQMGSGIAHVSALAGFEVYLNDIDQDRIDAGLRTIAGTIARQVSKGTITDEQREAALSRLKPASSYDDLSSCDLVIEAATENAELKREIFTKLCPTLKPDALVATNTSSIPITWLAAVTDRPERFIGIHFMNPVPVMQLVEIIRGIATDDSTFATAEAFALQLGKKITVAQDFPAFVVNRILLPMINEAVYTLYEGVGSVESIDTAMRFGANQPMGPLQLADFIGLDTCLSIMQVMHEGFADSKYRPCPLLVKYVQAGWLGVKTKRGFYDYRGERPQPTR
jgi:3-hydroxybutyryl-CoA dehydrogenase